MSNHTLRVWVSVLVIALLLVGALTLAGCKNSTTTTTAAPETTTTALEETTTTAVEETTSTAVEETTSGAEDTTTTAVSTSSS